MSETEIKLRVPAAALPALRCALARGRCCTTRLQATYFDTPEAQLAAAGCAFRLRREGRRWVQTLKALGDGALRRIEVEQARGAGRTRPAPDLALLLSNDDAARVLQRTGIGAGDAARLEPVFEVDVRRTHRVVRRGGARIELALDVGRIAAGGREEAVCELELELLSGPLDALIGLAARWAAVHGLWLDLRTKSERGWALARCEAALPMSATGSAAPRLTANMTASDALRIALARVLHPLVTHLARIAEGRGDAGDLHQARVGLRRVLSLLRLFGGGEHAAWIEQGRALLGRLGAARDLDVLEAWLLPALREAGAPPLVLPSHGAAAAARQDPGHQCRSPECSAWLLALLAFADGAASAELAGDAATPPVLQVVGPRLARLHRRLRRAGHGFLALGDEQRHRHRRQLKRLRYAAEALSPLFPPRRWRDYESRLKAAQEALGGFNDLCVAEALLSRMQPDDPGVAFARGWLVAARPAALRRAARSLVRLAEPPAFLR